MFKSGYPYYKPTECVDVDCPNLILIHENDFMEIYSCKVCGELLVAEFYESGN